MFVVQQHCIIRRFGITMDVRRLPCANSLRAISTRMPRPVIMREGIIVLGKWICFLKLILNPIIRLYIKLVT